MIALTDKISRLVDIRVKLYYESDHLQKKKIDHVGRIHVASKYTGIITN